MVRDSIPLFDHNVAIVWLMGELQPLHARNFLHFSNFSPISLSHRSDIIINPLLHNINLCTPYTLQHIPRHFPSSKRTSLNAISRCWLSQSSFFHINHHCKTLFHLRLHYLAPSVLNSNLYVCSLDKIHSWVPTLESCDL